MIFKSYQSVRQAFNAQMSDGNSTKYLQHAGSSFYAEKVVDRNVGSVVKDRSAMVKSQDLLNIIESERKINQRIKSFSKEPIPRK